VISKEMSARASKVSKAGIVIAIVGPDGSGKTTLAHEIVSAFGSSPRAFTSHLGGPVGGTWLTRPLRSVITGLRKVLWIIQGVEPSKDAKNLYPAFQAMLDVCKAIDRKLLTRRCHKQKDAGYIVVTDRYPGRVPGSASGPRKSSRGNSVAARQLHRIEIGI
jgi:thymidylate kinase